MANSHFFFKGDNMSIWNIKEEKRNIKKLNGDKVVDILIIGGGLTGLNSAYFLKNNKKVCVVDASVIGHGVTMGSTAKINYLQDSIYTKIIKATSYNNAVKYLNSQKESIDLLVNIIKSEKIDCDLEKVPSYIFANREKEIEALEKEVNFLKKNNINIKEKKLPMKVLSYKSFYVDDTYIFNPIKYLNGLREILEKNIPNYLFGQLDYLISTASDFKASLIECFTRDNLLDYEKDDDSFFFYNGIFVYHKE